jgi:hypothetical protein
MKYLFLLCYCMILGGPMTLEQLAQLLCRTTLEEAYNKALDQGSFLEDFDEFAQKAMDGSIVNPDLAFELLASDHEIGRSRYPDRFRRVKAFMRECGIEFKNLHHHHMTHHFGNYQNLENITDMKILMFLLDIDCPDYKDYFFTSKGELLNDKTRAPIDLWEFLDHYGVKYKQCGPKFNSQTLGVSVDSISDLGTLDVLDVFFAIKDEPGYTNLESTIPSVTSINAPSRSRFITKLIQTYLPQESKIMQENNVHEIYISYNCNQRYTGSSNSTAIAWGLHAAAHELETPATVFTGSIDRESGAIEEIGSMRVKHGEAQSVGLPMIVPEKNIYKINGWFESWLPYNRYSNVKPIKSLEELFSIASSMETLKMRKPLLDPTRYMVKPINTGFARLLAKLPTKNK